MGAQRLEQRMAQVWHTNIILEHEDQPKDTKDSTLVNRQGHPDKVESNQTDPDPCPDPDPDPCQPAIKLLDWGKEADTDSWHGVHLNRVMKYYRHGDWNHVCWIGTKKQTLTHGMVGIYKAIEKNLITQLPLEPFPSL